ncbi:Sugar lactone lactonase YvrE [Streptoalloteichus hindustanus]|uniref:Sugar lactone lactonase YvrE n=1 Tax=Streptoalloteichus hindustanus TaxID=2017 RepID=A0A1M5MW39_STRHI|nr:Sugar lactone lactonase YvrE [Streptoalloteichus hindustanus]
MALAAATLAVVPAAPVEAGEMATSRAYPTSFPLPAGFRPEGIAIGSDGFAYFGSMGTGAIYKADLATGNGKVLRQGGSGSAALGLKVDSRGRLFVAGGGGGNARVIDSRTGDVLATYRLASSGSFVNDVVIASDAVWLTDSTNPVLYKLPLGRGGELPAPSAVVRLRLTGDLVYQEGTNANGIATTPDGSGLLVIQWNTGKLFRVDPATGVARTVDLRGESLPRGDGMLREGNTLFVVQNRLNQVAVVQLNPTGTTGTVTTRVTDPRFDVPTTVASFRDRLYLPNARFNTPPRPTTPYNVVSIPRP